MFSNVLKTGNDREMKGVLIYFGVCAFFFATQVSGLDFNVYPSRFVVGNTGIQKMRCTLNDHYLRVYNIKLIRVIAPGSDTLELLAEFDNGNTAVLNSQIQNNKGFVVTGDLSASQPYIELTMDASKMDCSDARMYLCEGFIDLGAGVSTASKNFTLQAVDGSTTKAPGGVATVGTTANCRDGYLAHGQSCYALLPLKATWTEAQQYCTSQGASLAVIEDCDESNFVHELLYRKHNIITTGQVWIGGTELLEEGKWVAPNTLEPLTFFNWAPSQPDNIGGQHCLAIINDGTFKWDDNHCGIKNFFLCEADGSSDHHSVIIG